MTWMLGQLPKHAVKPRCSRRAVRRVFGGSLFLDVLAYGGDPRSQHTGGRVCPHGLRGQYKPAQAPRCQYGCLGEAGTRGGDLCRLDAGTGAVGILTPKDRVSTPNIR